MSIFFLSYIIYQNKLVNIPERIDYSKVVELYEDRDLGSIMHNQIKYHSFNFYNPLYNSLDNNQLEKINYFFESYGRNYLQYLPYFQTYEMENHLKDDGITTFSLDPRFQWVSGDVHTHNKWCIDDNFNYTIQEIMMMSNYSDLNVTSLLIWNKGLSIQQEREMIDGKDSSISYSGKIIHYDAEISGVPSAAWGGHILLLNLENLNRFKDFTIYPKSTILIIDFYKTQEDVFVGFAHPQLFPQDNIFEKPYVHNFSKMSLVELPIQIARGKIDFIETEGEEYTEVINTGLNIWSRLENSGFKVPLAGSSDNPCVGRGVGFTKTYVLIEGNLTYEKFLESLKMGRSVITNDRDEWLTFTVNNQTLGSEVNISSGEKIFVDLHTSFKNTTQVLLDINGENTKYFYIEPGQRITSIKGMPILNKSSWITFQTFHTIASPVYINVDNKPIRALADDACYLMRFTEIYIKLGEMNAIDFGEDREQILKAYHEAYSIFEQRFKESGGSYCKPLPGDPSVSSSSLNNILEENHEKK